MNELLCHADRLVTPFNYKPLIDKRGTNAMAGVTEKPGILLTSL